MDGAGSGQLPVPGHGLLKAAIASWSRHRPARQAPKLFSISARRPVGIDDQRGEGSIKQGPGDSGGESGIGASCRQARGVGPDDAGIQRHGGGKMVAGVGENWPDPGCWATCCQRGSRNPGCTPCCCDGGWSTTGPPSPRRWRRSGSSARTASRSTTSTYVTWSARAMTAGMTRTAPGAARGEREPAEPHRGPAPDHRPGAGYPRAA